MFECDVAFERFTSLLTIRPIEAVVSNLHFLIM